MLTNVIMLNVVILNVIKLTVAAPYRPPPAEKTQLPDRRFRNRIFVLRLPDVAPLFRRPEQTSGSGEEPRQRRLKDLDERLELLRQSDQWSML